MYSYNKSDDVNSDISKNYDADIVKDKLAQLLLLPDDIDDDSNNDSFELIKFSCSDDEYDSNDSDNSDNSNNSDENFDGDDDIGDDCNDYVSIENYEIINDIEVSNINTNTNECMHKYKCELPMTDISYFKESINNANWCDYCVRDIFMHEASVVKFIDKCVNMYIKNKKIFFDKREAHMLGSLLTLDHGNVYYLSNKCPELYNNYKTNALTISDSRVYVIDGIINQYNERIYKLTTNDKQNNNANNLQNKSYDDWLIFNNIQCEYCGHYACPFHAEHSSFSTRTINNKKLYCCGWCCYRMDNNIYPHD